MKRREFSYLFYVNCYYLLLSPRDYIAINYIMTTIMINVEVKPHNIIYIICWMSIVN